MFNAQGSSVGITAPDLERSIDFYTKGLGFEITDRGDRDGKLQYVSMNAGTATLAVGRDDFAKGKARVKGVGMRLWFQTNADLTALVARINAAGFAVESEPAALPWGPMAFSLKDPDGVSISISNG